MRKIVDPKLGIWIVLFSLSLSNIHSQVIPATPSVGALLRLLEVSLDLKGVVQLVENTNFDPATFRKFVIIDGSVAGITVIDANKETFFAEVELVQGEWIGTEEIRLYRVFIYFQGPAFEKILTEQIQIHDYALVIGSIEDVYVDRTGHRHPVLLALSIRKLH